MVQRPIVVQTIQANLRYERHGLTLIDTALSSFIY